MKIDIALATYNSAAWLDALFESIVAQDFTDWRIIARDDASKDDTGVLLSRWKQRLGERLLLLEDSGTANLGIVGNYNAILGQSTAPWVMLADSDDVWLPGKILLTNEAMSAVERSSSEKTPLLVCSDATVVDEHLGVIAPSYCRWMNHDPGLLNVFHRLIVESPALTSTIMVNRALLDIALPLTGASCHDWWLALTACAFGKIIYLPQCTILYRRHSANDSPMPIAPTLSDATGRLRQARERADQLIRQYAPQAGAFACRFGDRIQARDAAALKAAESLPSIGPVSRRNTIIRHNLWFASPVKNAGLMLFL